MSEYDHEPIRGLPGNLPQGEQILWQGSPDARTFARSALHTRWITGYFVLLAAIAMASGSMFGVLAIAASGVIVLALLHLFATLVARTTVYTITNRRLVLRIGVALNKCINLPLGLLGSAELRPQQAGFGDIAVKPTAAHRLGYAMLWPHARPFRFGEPEPMLRAVGDAAEVANILARACAQVTAIERSARPADEGTGSPAFRPAGAVA